MVDDEARPGAETLADLSVVVRRRYGLTVSEVAVSEVAVSEDAAPDDAAPEDVGASTVEQARRA